MSNSSNKAAEDYKYNSFLISLIKNNDFISKYNSCFLNQDELHLDKEVYGTLLCHFEEIANTLNSRSKKQIIDGKKIMVFKINTN